MATISINNLARALYESTEGKTGTELKHTLENGVALLAEKHMLGKSDEILAQLERIIDEESGTVRAHITSSKKLSKKNIELLEKELKRRYKATEIVLDLTEDKKLLDGIRIEVGDECIDLSLANKVHQLQDYLLKN